MNLYFDKLEFTLKSKPQIIRILTEEWTAREIFCPECEGELIHAKNNSPVFDFYCRECKQKYELKSKKDLLHYKKIPDGSYSKMKEKILRDEVPNFFFLGYDENILMVTDFFVLPSHFFSLSVIEKRKSLSYNAKRAGWTGCNIILGEIPPIGRIYYVKDKKVMSRKEIINNWRKTLFLRENKYEERGWLLDVMRCINKIGKEEFSLKELYDYEEYLKMIHPHNKHIKDKIRQQLQYLRDKNYW